MVPKLVYSRSHDREWQQTYPSIKQLIIKAGRAFVKIRRICLILKQIKLSAFEKQKKNEKKITDYNHAFASINPVYFFVFIWNIYYYCTVIRLFRFQL